jgi:hypothetical protein
MNGRNKRANRKRIAPSLACFKSAITNGSALLHDVDGRSQWMRRLRDLIGAHVSDIGGDDALSAAEMALVRRAAMLTLQLELMESRWRETNGEASPRSLEVYQRATGALRRTLEALGLQRRSKDVTPHHRLTIDGLIDGVVKQSRQARSTQ